MKLCEIPTVTIPDITIDSAAARAAMKIVPIADIDALRQRAEAAGDEDLVALCDHAAEGFFGRLSQLERVEAMEQIRAVLAKLG